MPRILPSAHSVGPLQRLRGQPTEGDATDTAQTAILLVNLGTPDAPDTAAVRRYLRQFLSDPRVVELPRLFWLPLLHGIVSTSGRSNRPPGIGKYGRRKVRR